MTDISKVRKRASYQTFMHMANFFKGNTTLKEKMEYVHNMIDQYSGYKSQQNSYYARESMEQVLKDIGETK